MRPRFNRLNLFWPNNRVKLKEILHTYYLFLNTNIAEYFVKRMTEMNEI